MSHQIDETSGALFFPTPHNVLSIQAQTLTNLHEEWLRRCIQSFSLLLSLNLGQLFIYLNIYKLLWLQRSGAAFKGDICQGKSNLPSFMNNRGYERGIISMTNPTRQKAMAQANIASILQTRQKIFFSNPVWIGLW